MSRAVLLPTPGDNPFLVSYWLRNYRTWAEHVDQLYVCPGWRQPANITERITADIEAAGGIVVRAPADRGDPDHGQSMQALVAAAREDVLLFIEDDVYIREPGIIDQLFRAVEDGETDIVGVPRGSMGQELVTGCGHKYPGPALWPNMLIAQAERFRALTETYSARSYNPGDVITGVGYVVQTEGQSADTFGAASMEMQEGARLHALPEYAMFYDRQGPYIHIGSLSSGPAPLRHGDLTGQNPDSWAIRTALWRRFGETWPGGLDDEHALYVRHVGWLVEYFGAERVAWWTNAYNELVTWDE